MDGLTAARLILTETASRVLMLTTFDSDEYVYAALRAGASGFLLKDAPAEQLVSAVRSVAAGDALIDPSITRRLITQFVQAVRPDPVDSPRLAALTARERDVLRLVAQGLSNAEIAADLAVEESTVKTHVGRILMKLDLRDRVQAVVIAYESGFVVPDPAGIPYEAGCPTRGHARLWTGPYANASMASGVVFAGSAPTEVDPSALHDDVAVRIP